MRCAFDPKSHDSETQAGNAVAHGPNVVVDTALVQLEIFKQKHREPFQQLYQYTMAEFLGSPTAPLRLTRSPKFLELVNMRGSMTGSLAFAAESLCRATATAFKNLEAECKKVLRTAYKNSKDRDTARQVYNQDPSIADAHKQMAILVERMRELHKRRPRGRELAGRDHPDPNP